MAGAGVQGAEQVHQQLVHRFDGGELDDLPRTLNEFKYGLQHNVDQYNVGEGPDQFDVNGRLMRIAYPFVPPDAGQPQKLNLSRI